MKTEYCGYIIDLAANQVSDEQWASKYTIREKRDIVVLREEGELVRGFNTQAQAAADSLRRAKESIDGYTK